MTGIQGIVLAVFVLADIACVVNICGNLWLRKGSSVLIAFASLWPYLAGTVLVAGWWGH